MKKRILTVVLTFFIIFTNALPFVAGAVDVKNPFVTKTKKPLIVSRNGDTESHTENTLAAVISAFDKGADACLVDVSATADDRQVLLNENALSYLFAEEFAVKNIDRHTLDDLNSYTLLQERGGHFAVKTDDKLATLDELIDYARQKHRIIFLHTSVSNAPKCYELIKKTNSEDNFIFYITDSDIKTVSELFPAGDRPPIYVFSKSNVIFTVNSRIKTAAENKFSGLCLASRVPYSVSFMKSTTERLGDMNAMIDLTDASYSGKIRTDSSVWVDDLLDRGFSVFLTDNVERLRTHFDRIEYQASLAKKELEKKGAVVLPKANGKKSRELIKKYNDAVRDIESIDSSVKSLKFIESAIENLRQSYDEIGKIYGELTVGTAGNTVTPGRIVVAVLSIAFVLALEIFIAKHKKKNDNKE